MYGKLTMIGRLGQDPKVSSLPDGTVVCDFNLAVDRRLRNGEKETSWVQVRMFGKPAEIARQ